MANEYAELEELKVGMRRMTSTADDEWLQNALTRASRAIDRRTGRRFYKDGAATARVYRTPGNTLWEVWGETLLVDDISTGSGLVVEGGDGTTWTTLSGITTGPDNAIVQGRAIETLTYDNSCLSVYPKVRVTADWGWPAVPDDIVSATLLLANRRFMRRDSPEGVSGWSQEGPVRVSRFDPDIEDLVEDYVRDGFA